MRSKTTAPTEEELVKETVKKAGEKLNKKDNKREREINDSSHIACVSFVEANKREAGLRGCGAREPVYIRPVNSTKH